jgi:hypothetical protein
VDGGDVLPVDGLGRDAEGDGAGGDVAGGRLRVVRVLVVEVVLADVDHWQPPERGHVHDLVEQPLPERALAEEADGDRVGAAGAGGEGGAGGDPGRPADDGVRTQVAVLVVGDVHGPALAAAVALGLAEQLAEHPLGRGALGQAVSVAAVRARDVVVAAERLAHADGDGLLADVEMRQAGHLRAAVELVHALLEQADAAHPLVHAKGEVGREGGGVGADGRHRATSSPDMRASTS